MYNALDIARYIINYSNKNNYSISNLKLQKLLYFTQGFFLSIKDEACFSNKIEAWDFGPVIPEAYHTFKEFGANNIPEIKEYFEFDDKDFWNSKTIQYNDAIIQEEDKLLVNNVLETLKGVSATSLVKMTHAQYPWKDVYDRGSKNIEITQNSIKKYFKERYLKHE